MVSVGSSRGGKTMSLLWNHRLRETLMQQSCGKGAPIEVVRQQEPSTDATVQAPCKTVSGVLFHKFMLHQIQRQNTRCLRKWEFRLLTRIEDCLVSSWLTKTEKGYNSLKYRRRLIPQEEELLEQKGHCIWRNHDSKVTLVWKLERDVWPAEVRV